MLDSNSDFEKLFCGDYAYQGTELIDDKLQEEGLAYRVDDENAFVIWGVITATVHRLK